MELVIGVHQCAREGVTVLRNNEEPAPPDTEGGEEESGEGDGEE